MTRPTDKQRAEALAEAKEDLLAFENKIESLVITGSKQLRYARALLAEVAAREKAESQVKILVDTVKIGARVYGDYEILEEELAAARAKIAEFEAGASYICVECNEVWPGARVRGLVTKPCPKCGRFLMIVDVHERMASKLKIEQLEVTMARLRQALHFIVENLVPYAPDSDEGIAVTVARKALDTGSTDYERGIAELVSAVEYYSARCKEGCAPCDHLIAREALAKWRGEE